MDVDRGGGGCDSGCTTDGSAGNSKVALYKGREATSLDQCRKRRQNNVIQIRKQKRDDILNARRNINTQQYAGIGLSSTLAPQNVTLLDSCKIEYIIGDDPTLQLQAITLLSDNIRLDSRGACCVATLASLRILPRLIELFLIGKDDCEETSRKIAFIISTAANQEIKNYLEPEMVTTIIRSLVTMLNSGMNPIDPNLIEQMLICLGILAGHADTNAMFIFRCGIDSSVLPILRNHDLPRDVIASAVWLVSQLFEHVEDHGDAAYGSSVMCAVLEGLVPFLLSSDEVIKKDAARTVMNSVWSNVLTQTLFSSGGLRTVCETIARSPPSMALVSLKTISILVERDGKYTDYLLSYDLLISLETAISRPHLTKECCHLLSNICAEGEEKVSKVVMGSSSIMPHEMMRILQTANFDTRKEICFALCYCCELGTNCVRDFLLRMGIIEPFCDMLTTVLDSSLVLAVLNTLDFLLEQDAIMNTDVARSAITERGGVMKIEFLQDSHNIDIAIKSTEIMDRWFNRDDDDSEEEIGMYAESGDFIPNVSKGIYSALDSVINMVVEGGFRPVDGWHHVNNEDR